MASIGATGLRRLAFYVSALVSTHESVLAKSSGLRSADAPVPPVVEQPARKGSMCPEDVRPSWSRPAKTEVPPGAAMRSA
jgi:hypothetical protein